ncbi:MAG: monovalent cation/H+ antiporter complex subunit F [Thermoanaerobaculia bacterium]|nr:monovalent cation/H+ antiporter complex subunit F [Thermoanaerobaculia bacterium]
MFAVAMVAVLVSMAMLITHVFRSTRVFDRILGVNSFGTKTVLLIAVLGFLNGRPEFLDLALVYALMNFIGTIAVLRFTAYGDLARLDDDRAKTDDLGWPS